jgi:hypothetical protein
MALYLVALVAASNASTRKQGANELVVQANSEAQAKEAAAAHYDGDGAIWSTATVTELASTDDWEGWTFRVSICTTVPKVFTYVGTAANDTIDEIAAQLVILLNADADIAGAAYNTTTQTLKIAETTDALGDKKCIVEIIPPSGYSSVDSLVGTLTDEGASGDALTVVLPADNVVPPKVLAAAKSV